jgi:hypothetical protein
MPFGARLPRERRKVKLGQGEGSPLGPGGASDSFRRSPQRCITACAEYVGVRASEASISSPADSFTGLWKRPRERGRHHSRCFARRTRVNGRRAREPRGQKTCDTRRRKPIVRWSRGPSEGEGSTSNPPAANRIQTSVSPRRRASIISVRWGQGMWGQSSAPGGFPRVRDGPFLAHRDHGDSAFPVSAAPVVTMSDSFGMNAPG